MSALDCRRSAASATGRDAIGPVGGASGRDEAGRRRDATSLPGVAVAQFGATVAQSGGEAA